MTENIVRFYPSLTLTNLQEIMSLNLIEYRKLPRREVCLLFTSNIMFSGILSSDLFFACQTYSVCKHLIQAIRINKRKVLK